MFSGRHKPFAMIFLAEFQIEGHGTCKVDKNHSGSMGLRYSLKYRQLFSRTRTTRNNHLLFL